MVCPRYAQIRKSTEKAGVMLASYYVARACAYQKRDGPQRNVVRTLNFYFRRLTNKNIKYDTRLMPGALYVLSVRHRAARVGVAENNVMLSCLLVMC